MSEILKYEGKLQRRKQDLERLRLRMKGLVDSIRNHCDPTEEPAKLNTSLVAEEAFELDKLRTELLALHAEIAEINTLLGRG